MWIPSHVNIKGNDEVDEAAKKGTTKTQIENINIPPEDLKSIIKNHIKKKWSNSWYQKTNNKLRDIKDETIKWKVPEERKLQIVISRLRIGHTKFTHEHILNKTEPKICHYNVREAHNRRMHQIHNIQTKTQDPDHIEGRTGQQQQQYIQHHKVPGRDRPTKANIKCDHTNTIKTMM